jgi:uncharacterized protein
MNDAIDLEALNTYLSSDTSPARCMRLSDLDGFLHGVVCSPVVIPSKHWLPVVIECDPRHVPDWALTAIVDHYKGIAERLMSNPQVVDTIFWQTDEGHVDASDWCAGFMRAIALRPRKWLKITQSAADEHLFAPIIAHIQDDMHTAGIGTAQAAPDQPLADAARAIPDAVIDIFNYCRGK